MVLHKNHWHNGHRQIDGSIYCLTKIKITYFCGRFLSHFHFFLTVIVHKSWISQPNTMGSWTRKKTVWNSSERKIQDIACFSHFDFPHYFFRADIVCVCRIKFETNTHSPKWLSISYRRRPFWTDRIASISIELFIGLCRVSLFCVISCCWLALFVCFYFSLSCCCWTNNLLNRRRRRKNCIWNSLIFILNGITCLIWQEIQSSELHWLQLKKTSEQRHVTNLEKKTTTIIFIFVHNHMDVSDEKRLSFTASIWSAKGTWKKGTWKFSI